MRRRTGWLMAGAAALCLVLSAAPGRANMPVTDMTNFAQNLVSAIEAVDQTLAMIEQIQHDIEHHNTVLDDMIRNGAAPAVYTWDKLGSIHDRLRRISRGIRFDRMTLAQWLKQFSDLNFYRSAHCYGPDLSCPKREWDRILEQSFQLHELASHTRKQTLDDLMRDLEQGEQNLAEQSENLQDLQRQAQDAKGHMQALQAGNQLASAQATQLIEIRAIMYAHYWALAAQAQQAHALEAQQRAAGERYRRPMTKDSPVVYWTVLPQGPGL